MIDICPKKIFPDFWERDKMLPCSSSPTCMFLNDGYMCVILIQEVCYRLQRYNIRGTLNLVEKGCRIVTACTADMYVGSRGSCSGLECIKCFNRSSTCAGPEGTCGGRKCQ